MADLAETSLTPPADLPAHGLKVVLFQPQIAPNTGNVGRLCVAAGAELHLVRPLGFVLSDRNLKRSGMDYWPRLNLTLHDDESAFFRAALSPAPVPVPTPSLAANASPAAIAGAGAGRLWLFSSKARRGVWEAEFHDHDWLIFGSETRGLGEALLASHGERCLRIPQSPGERCLNLATAAGIALYEALRQVRAGPAPGLTGR